MSFSTSSGGGSLCLIVILYCAGTSLLKIDHWSRVRGGKAAVEARIAGGDTS